jgi:hypothetical protein
MSARCRPAALAETVFDGVRAKVQGLKAALAGREQDVQQLAQVCWGGAYWGAPLQSRAMLHRLQPLPRC